MSAFLLAVGIFLCFLMILTLYRAIVGPTVLDRLVGVNAIGSKTVVVLLLIGFLYHRVEMFVDIALAYALLNFIAVLGAAKYFYKRKGLLDKSRSE